MFGYLRLDEYLGSLGIDPRRQPIDDHLPGIALDILGMLVVGGQGMPVGDEEKALILVLQLQPVLQHPMIMTQMQTAGGTHTGQYALRLIGYHAQILINLIIYKTL